MADIFGNHIRDIGFSNMTGRRLKVQSNCCPLGILPSGFGLNGRHLGSALWDRIWDAGQRFDIKPAVHLIEHRRRLALWQ